MKAKKELDEWEERSRRQRGTSARRKSETKTDDVGDHAKQRFVFTWESGRSWMASQLRF